MLNLQVYIVNIIVLESRYKGADISPMFSEEHEFLHGSVSRAMKLHLLFSK